MPPGFEVIRDKWNNLCAYTGNANGNYALCNIPINTHAWRHPGQYNPGFMCGTKGEWPPATLSFSGAFSKVPAGITYAASFRMLNTGLVSTRILSRRTAPFAPFLIPYRVPHGLTPRS